jgi:hypothetical protein
MEMDVRFGVLISTLFTVFIVLLSSIPASEGLQCYNCRGITNYDPNECFVPVNGKTVIQECQKGESCETRVTMVDRLQDVIDRGCSSNCNQRQFVWTDEFQVYCCSDNDLCNHATTTSRLHLWTFTTLLCVAIYAAIWCHY